MVNWNILNIIYQRTNLGHRLLIIFLYSGWSNVILLNIVGKKKKKSDSREGYVSRKRSHGHKNQLCSINTPSKVYKSWIYQHQPRFSNITLHKSSYKIIDISHISDPKRNKTIERDIYTTCCFSCKYIKRIHKMF